MAGRHRLNSFVFGLAGWLQEVAATMACWAYFTLGFILIFSGRYIGAYLFSSGRERSFQRLNSLFYQGFFRVVRYAAPQHHWQIDEEIATISSSVIVCNHVSYLDPLLLIALFERHKTIVKTKFFRIPIFGWVLRNSGYFPADSEGEYARMMLDQIEEMGGFLDSGGNLFVFPEGTRSRDGKVGELNRGALKIARLCNAPIYVLHLANTEKLFTPGKFLFNTRVENTITMRVADCIEPSPDRRDSLTGLEDRVRRGLARHCGKDAGTS